ncbi:hypothetical protein JYU34_018092 [Plutella xylostella]|uniref:Trissin n=1 Tax=Plutella xylostella TaxID=51655 RepID=A0ABQ7PZR9_PLUXY|nr:hypothetical protein JYU34_018092 [Plutella xylostella]
MLKFAAIVSLMLIVVWPQADSRRHKKDATPSNDFDPGSTIWAAGLSCESCGRECAAACGTRHFRACCFNYLRRKRVSPGVASNKHWPSRMDEEKMDDRPRLKKIPIFAIEDVPEPWMSNEIDSYAFEDSFENRLPLPYDM